MKKKILILNTGGTISSARTLQGYVPLQGYIESMLKKHPSLHHPQLPEFCIQEYDPLLDSANFTLDNWNQIAQDINQAYHQYDGFIIFHGTDTMAYTASALSFMLEHLAKPVILTGSQIPLSEIRNDALDNIINSLYICSEFTIPEVCIYFNGILIRGNRAQKVSSQRLNAFDSPNFPHLASIDIKINLHPNLILPLPSQTFYLSKLSHQFIANFRLFPSCDLKIFAHFLQSPLKGLILETYGAGNAPNKNKQFLSLLSEAVSQGMIIINCSQCPHGFIEMDQYATGYALKKAGLISGYDMTLEAAHCKLLYLLSKGYSDHEIKKQFETNIRGELSLERHLLT